MTIFDSIISHNNEYYLKIMDIDLGNAGIYFYINTVFGIIIIIGKVNIIQLF